MKSNRQVVAVFDFDGTLTVSDSYNAFFKNLWGPLKWYWFLLTHWYLFAGYLTKLVSNQAVKEAMLMTLRGLDESKLEKIGKEFSSTALSTLLRNEAIQEVKWHRRHNHRVIVASASLAAWVKPMALQMDIHEWITSEPEIIGRKLTGKLKINCYGEIKKDMVEKKLEGEEVTVFAYGDSPADVPLLSLASYPCFRSFPHAKE